MTSVNELNAETRGYNRGKREGYEIGYQSAMEKAREYGLAVRWMKLVIAIVIGYMIGMAVTAHGQVTVGASVPCNEYNCPIEEEHEQPDLLERMWSAILGVLK